MGNIVPKNSKTRVKFVLKTRRFFFSVVHKLAILESEHISRRDKDEFSVRSLKAKPNNNPQHLHTPIKSSRDSASLR